MKTCISLCTAAAVALVLLWGAQANEQQEVTIKGSVTCAKCDLKQEKACATVVVEKKDGKDVVYYFDTASDKKHHGAICTTPTPGTVKGTVEDKGGKKTVTVKELTFGK